VRFEVKIVFFFFFEKRSSLKIAGVVVVTLGVVGLAPGANPAITSFNSSVVKIYYSNNSLARF
jgi:hypothetical protein